MGRERVMNIGMARAIFENLFDSKYSIEEKGTAIRTVIDMETHNSITKIQMLKAMNWMWEQIFELKQKNDMISRQTVRYKLAALVNEFEEILSHIREREVDDSVCGLCEYDGAYIGQSGDWCNECPGFDKDDCFKLKEKYRKEWTDING